MAYEGVGPYYPWTGAGDGTSNNILQSSDPGSTNNTTTTASVGTSGAGDYPMKSLFGSNAKSTYSTTAYADGYNMTAANTNAADGVSKRQVAAGTWTMTGGVGITSGTGFPVGGSVTVRVNVYARQVTGGTYRYLGTLSGTGSPVALSTVTWTVTGSLSAVTLDVGETIHIEVWYTVPNALLTNYVLSHVVGTGYNLTLPGTGLRYLYSKSLAATSSSAAAISRRISLTAKVATSSAAGAMSRTITATRSLAATSSGVAAFARTLTGLRAFSASSTPVAIRQPFAIRLRPLSASSSSSAALQPFTISLAPKTATSSAVASIARLMNKSLSASSTATAVFARQFQGLRALAATATSTGRMYVQISQTILNRMSGGGTTVVRKVMSIVFDD